MFQQFLSAPGAGRVSTLFRKLARHDIRHWAITGGLAVEIHCLRLGRPSSPRTLNDVDFIAESFDGVPESLGNDFLIRHVHPLAPPGKTMLQFIDPESALRADVFRASDRTMHRASVLEFPERALRLISLEDLLARTARLALALAEAVPTPAKHAVDFLRLAELIDPAAVEAAWQDHRKPKHPAGFHETNLLLRDLIPASRSLLITPEHSKDIEQVCPRCAPTAAFPLADPKMVFSVIGYC